jgi:magnesium-transporting ATPase (P-type)
MNKMTITALLWGEKGEYMVPIHNNEDTTGSANDEDPIIDRQRPSLKNAGGSSAMKDLLLGACVCNNAVKQSSNTDENGVENEASENEATENTTLTKKLVGDAADVALYNLCQDKCNVDIEHTRTVNPRVNVLPFNSKNKFMITANILEQVSTDKNKENILITLKGAPDFVLSRCSTYKADDGNELLPMTDEFKRSIQQRQEALGKSGYRVIAMLQQRI